MPLNSRDLWLVLKAQDQTNRALNSFSRNVRNAGNQVRAAQLEASRAASLGTISQAKLNSEVLKSEVAQLAAAKAAQQYAFRQKDVSTLTQAEIDGHKQKISAIDKEIVARKGQIAGLSGVIANEKVHLETVKDSIAQNNAYNRSIQDQEKNLAHLGGRLQSVAQTATATGFALAAMGALTLIGLKKAVDTAVEYEKQVRLTATQVDHFSGNLEELAKIGRDVASQIAVPFKEVQPALFDVFSSMDVTVTQAGQLLKQFSKAAVAGQSDIQSVSRATIGILNAFGLPASEVNHILDVQFKLIQKGIGTYEEWNQRIGLVTPSAVRAGQSIEVMVAALAESTREGSSAARASTAVSRAFDALSNPAAVKALKELGVSALDAKGKFRPFNDVLRDFREVLMKMPEKDRLKTILDVFKGAGGTIEARRFLQNMLLGKGNLEDFDKILNEVKNSSGSMEKAYSLMADTAAAKSQVLANNWDLLKEGLGRALIPAFSKIVGWLTQLVQWFNKLPESSKKTIAMVVLLGGVFASIGGPLLLIIGAISAFAAAIAVAGTALVVTVAALVSFVAIAAVVAAAFVLMYKKSFEFRVMIGQIGQYLTLFKEELQPIAKEAVDTFKNKLLPPLERLANIISTKVQPAFTIWMNTIMPVFIDKVGEAGRILKDILGKAFEVIGKVIDTVVIPAVKFATNWFNDHRETIAKLAPIIAQVVKWLLIIAGILIGVLAVALIGPVVGAVTAVIVVFGLLVAAIVYVAKFVGWLWDKIKQFGSWIAGVFVSLWNTVSDAVVSAWNGITSFFSGLWAGIVGIFTSAWNWIVGIFNTVTGAIGAAWDNFWNSKIGGTVKAVWELIKSIVNLGIASVQFVISWAVEGIKNTWNVLWDAVSNKVKEIWYQITTLLSLAWSTIIALFHSVWDPIKAWFSGLWNAIVAYVSFKWAELKALATTVFNGIKQYISDKWNQIKGEALAAWNTVLNYIREPMEKARQTVVDKITAIKNFFSGAKSWLIHAGEDIINGLLDGITKTAHKITDKINEITKSIKDHLPGSPVKKGPLKVLNNGYAGKQITRMIANGMTADTSIVRNAISQVTANIANGYDMQTPDLWNGTNRTNSGNGKVYNINQTINTQEISPVRQAAALGWEVTTVL